MLPVLVACAFDTDPALAQEGPGRAGDVPAIYVDQHVELHTDGGNPQQAAYEYNLEVCEAAGLPIDPLPPEDQARVGTSRVQVWVEADRAAHRVESWHFENATPTPTGLECRFVLASRGSHGYYDVDRTVSIDLSNNKRYESGPEPRTLDRSPSPVAPATRGNRTIAGQPCEELPVAGFEHTVVCAWSGGHAWGFGHGAPADTIPLDQPQKLLRYVVLSQEPGADDGHRVVTNAFRVGGPGGGPDMLPAPATGIPSELVGK